MCKTKQNLFILTFLFLFLTLFLLTPQSARAYMLYENPSALLSARRPTTTKHHLNRSAYLEPAIGRSRST